MDRNQIEQWNTQLSSKKTSEILSWASHQFGRRLVFATSLGAEDQVITHLLAQTSPDVRIFTLDTGRMFPETYDLIEKTESHYNVKIEIFVPDRQEVESMVEDNGINLFHKTVELRKLCCHVRKVHPLQRALQGMQGWICGLRKEQSQTREDIAAIEWDTQNQLAKVNPLWNWTAAQVWQTIRECQIPYNPLHDSGYLSIGCSCCTRPVGPGEDIRSGRWWWENAGLRECGLHFKDGKFSRSADC